MRTLNLMLALPVCSMLATAGFGAILQRWNFEGADPLHDLKIEGEKPKVISDPLNPANHVMESVLRSTSERAERSEVRWDRIEYGAERWVSVRILVPDRNPNFRCLFQVGPIKNPTDASSKGFIQLQLPAAGGEWIGRVFLERIKRPMVRSGFGAAELGKWETWVMHFRLADDDKGFIEIWRGARKVYAGTGPNARAGDRTPLKWGIYISIGNRLQQDSRVLYDDIVLGDEHSSYEEVVKRD